MSNASENTPGLALRINGYSQLSHLLNPSSEIGPEPVHIPVTGYSLHAEMVCFGTSDIIIVGLKAEVKGRKTPFQSDGTMIGQKPLEIPHFEILLDNDPPLIRAALKADGQPARLTPQLPFTLHPNEYRSFFLAPVTHNRDLMVWSLSVMWELEGKRIESSYGTFQVTGYTGWTIHAHDGTRPAPVGLTPARDHWDIQNSSG